MSGQIVKSDVSAREAMEVVLLAAAQRDPARALEACDLIAELARSGYRLTALAEPSAVAARPVKLRARYDGLCVACGAEVHVDDEVWWTRGESGVQCGPCGGPA